VITDWDDRFMTLVEAVRTWSRDESTKIGCAIRGTDNEVLALGYNGCPRGISYTPERHNRPEKYQWFEHAERNAIYNAARTATPLADSIFYINWLPCPDCARGIIQVGAHSVVVPSFGVPQRWRSRMEKAVLMLEEAGVRMRCIKDSHRTAKYIIAEMENYDG
jgi:dCMP deaminase